MINLVISRNYKASNGSMTLSLSFLCPFPITQCDELDAAGTGCSDQNMNLFCKDHDFSGWYEVSALSGICVDESAKFLVQEVISSFCVFYILLCCTDPPFSFS